MNSCCVSHRAASPPTRDNRFEGREMMGPAATTTGRGTTTPLEVVLRAKTPLVLEEASICLFTHGTTRPGLQMLLVSMYGSKDPSVDTSNPAKRGRRKTGHRERALKRVCCSAFAPERASGVFGDITNSAPRRDRGALSRSAPRHRRDHAPETARSPWRRVRQLRGPHVRTCA